MFLSIALRGFELRICNFAKFHCNTFANNEDRREEACPSPPPPPHTVTYKKAQSD